MRPAVNLFSPKIESLINHPDTPKNSRDPCAHSSHRPGLLVSVRNWQEASTALNSGVDVLDLKEPFRGPLGFVEPDEILNVIAGLDGNIDRHGRVPLSVALGELSDWAQPGKANDRGNELVTRSVSEDECCPSLTLRVSKNLKPLPMQVRFAKLGLAGMGSQADWQILWHRAMSQVGEHISPVAVAYADHALADSPDPDEILAFAVESGCKAFLIDTWEKSAGSLTRHLSVQAITHFVERARAVGMTIALAGSLSLSDIPAIVQCKPDLIAIRSAACSGGRSGTICSEKIGEFKRQIMVNSSGVDSLTFNDESLV